MFEVFVGCVQALSAKQMRYVRKKARRRAARADNGPVAPPNAPPPSPPPAPACPPRSKVSVLLALGLILSFAVYLVFAVVLARNTPCKPCLALCEGYFGSED